MNDMLAELGSGLADRWAAVLLPSALLFLTVAGVAGVLGQTDWYDLDTLDHDANHLAGQPGAHAPGVLLLATAGLLLAAAGAGLAVRALGGGVRLLWQGDWPQGTGWLRCRLTERRLVRWTVADQAYAEALRAHARHTVAALRTGGPGTADHLGDTPSAADAARLRTARNRIAPCRPVGPTWTGDRIRSVDQRVLTAYDLDLDSAWPRLWLILPDAERTELRTARDAYDTAATLAAWALPYLALGIRWWPALLVSLAVAGIGLRRGRAAADALCELLEATVDLHNRALAEALGVPCPGPFDRDTGTAVTRIVHKNP
ncbi:hypothetical protein [Streptacidiphilus sp. P02-A3a]|uniref:hypothetical protein n=1 Tax=Streptacidiphilus sp. P02-A3a TaxID=2704468 RepID=UPI0015FAD76C|nr:hypothetical protein [Streptacidiphilus sp. P02-A3a]QMU69606.1 hypothetical protein GXP74_16530 [Streptacidiphilus sp. P02-A3a]